jgi:hypothetical protein
LFLRALLAALGPAAAGSPAAAQSDTATTSIEVSDRLHVTTLQPVTLTDPAMRTIAQAGSVVSATATIEIRGGSDQAYSVSLSRAGAGSSGVTVEDVTAWSENANQNLGGVFSGRTNSAGRDVVLLSGKVHLPREATSDGGTASMTLSFEYQ